MGNIRGNEAMKSQVFGQHCPSSAQALVIGSHCIQSMKLYQAVVLKSPLTCTVSSCSFVSCRTCTVQPDLVSRSFSLLFRILSNCNFTSFLAVVLRCISP